MIIYERDTPMDAPCEKPFYQVRPLRLDAATAVAVQGLQNKAFADTGERLWMARDMADFFTMPGLLILGLMRAERGEKDHVKQQKMLEKTRGEFGISGSELSGLLVGCALFLCTADQADLLMVAILPEWQKQGAGRFLLQAGLKTLKDLSISSLFLEVRDGNAAANCLYLSLGFKRLGKRKNYYHLKNDRYVDALLYGFNLIEL